MAAATFHPDLQRFPIGTAAKVFTLGTPRRGELAKLTGNPEGWPNPPAKLGEPTVSAAGVLEMNIGTAAGELPAGTPAIAWASTAGADQYLYLRADESGVERL